MSDADIGQGYDYEPPASEGGRAGWIQLKKKGDQVRVRLFTAPVHYKKKTTWNGKEEEKTRFLWGVIERSAGGDVVKLYEAGGDVYRKVKDYFNNPDWGDPTGYDFTITRNMQNIGEGGSGEFYSLVPNPKSIRPLNEAEMQLIADAKVDLVTLAQRLAKKSGMDANSAPPADPTDVPATASPEDDVDPF